MDQIEGSDDLEVSATSSSKSNKRVSRRKRVKRPKERGRYKPKAQPELANGDLDLAECLFSDEETRADFVAEHNTAVNDDGQLPEELGWFTSANCDDGQGEEIVDQISASESESSGSRPGSAASVSHTALSDESRPSSSLSSRPPSAGPFERPLSALSSHSDVSMKPEVSTECISRVLLILKALLPSAWLTIGETDSIHLLLINAITPKAIQREVIVYFSGKVKTFVHRACVSGNSFLVNRVQPLTSAENAVIQKFCEKCVSAVQTLMSYEVCVGANHFETKATWTIIPDTYVDRNPYGEGSFTETCRSVSCQRLVKVEMGKVPRCSDCNKVMKSLKKRQEFLTSESAPKNTPNAFLTPAQVMQKNITQSKEIRKKDKQIFKLRQKLEMMLEKEGVTVEEDINADLIEALKTAKLSPMMHEFLTSQVECAGKEVATSRKWHPSMIRFALYLQSNMTRAGYEGVRDSGVMILPSTRTLYDYSHAIEAQEGVSEGILKIVANKVEKQPLQYQKYHVLLCDEMYISKNLVYKRSDNSLVGYANLSTAERELKDFEAYIEKEFTGVEQNVEPDLAKTILAYMVKGVATSLKYIVAIFPIKDLTADSLYSRSWKVIARLEKAGVKVLALVCDGAPTNRTFINMHVPITVSKNGVIFDTVNFCSPELRPLFFISDVCHLLKTIRNCLYNSGESDKKPRCMQINGQTLQWKTIVRLYFKFKDRNFRKSYKLNAQNVFPNSYSVMRVRYAAEVLTNTVANDIDSLNWDGTSELVKFIKYVNKFFDCFNGAYYMQHVRTKNKNLAPFFNGNDERLDWVGVPNPDSVEVGPALAELPFLEYLGDWKRQVHALSVSGKLKEKMLLAHQTLHGIEMASRGIAGAIRYVFTLQEPPKYVMARAFSQDPLEQGFSTIRAKAGPGHNPNVAAALGSEVAMAVHKDLGMRRRKGNVTDSADPGTSSMKVDNEPLAKRARSSKKRV